MPEPYKSPTVAMAAAPPPDWVPVDRRWLGMDRRTLLPAGVVAVLVAVTFWLLPFIDSHTAVNDPIKAGDVVRVGDVQFAAATGWNLEDGLRAGTADSGTYPEQAVLAHDGVTFAVQSGDFTGTATTLLNQIKKNNDKLGSNGVDLHTSQLTAFETVSGAHGVLARFSTTNASGLIGAIVLGQTGIQVTVYGPTSLDSSPGLERDVVSMIRSIQPADGASS